MDKIDWKRLGEQNQRSLDDLLARHRRAQAVQELLKNPRAPAPVKVAATVMMGAIMVAEAAPHVARIANRLRHGR